ncbi:hypothetical protein [Enterococcus rotai]|uniref:hypothetical protein n=1 Tax=Enterococcus rotai TaxID=118060 RepID=UPI0032B3C80B
MRRLVTRELPNYTQYEIASLVNKEVNARNQNITELSLSLGVDDNIIREIIDGEVIFKMPHYNVASKILNISIEELLAEYTFEQDCYFRSEANNQEVDEFVNKMGYLFTEWIYQKKIAGDI